MPSGQDLARRLTEEARRAVSARVSEVGTDIDNLQALLSSFLSQLQARLQELPAVELPFDSLVDESLAETKRAAEAAARLLGEKLISVSEFTREVRGKETQEEVLDYLLEGTRQFARRVGLLVVRGERFRGWSSRGLAAEASSRFGRIALHRDESAWLSGAIASDDAAENRDLPTEAAWRDSLGDEAGGTWHALALRALGKPVAVLVASGDEEREADICSLRLLLDVTGLCLENTALRILQELRVSASRGAPSVAAPAAPAQGAPPAVEPATVPPESAPPAPPETAAPEPVVPVVETAPPAAEAAPSADEAAAGELDRTLEAIRQTLHSLEHEAVEARPPVAIPPAPPAVPSYPPPGVGLASGSEEERLHADAKRFARLLVSEIKLYNEQRVLEGRDNRDIYVRLKRDIDRSREMYEKRVAPAVARKVDYFHDEIIRILGDNDPSTLGSDYPGPRVES